jgi:ABC-2 type transport system ATP-binding protein/sodium transport system ATP-binding protein
MSASPAPALRAAPETGPGPTLLEARSIAKAWPNGVSVLRGVDLELQRGSAAWVGGSNGVGKTTLLRILAGILRPDAGGVELGGLDPGRDRRAYHSRIGFLSAGDRGLHARLTTRQHLDYWAKLAYLPRGERPGAVARAVELLDLGELAAKRVDRLSMGQRQRVRLSLVVLHQPDLVLLDEPRNSLDDHGYALLDRVVEHTLDRGGAVLWCSPRLEDGSDRFDAEYLLEHGELRRCS